MNRRNLLIGAAGATTAAALAALSPLDRLFLGSTSEGAVLRGAFFRRPTFNYVPGALYSADTATERHAFEWNITTGAQKIVELTLPTHVVETHPHESRLSILTTQKTGRSAVIDWKLSKQIASLDLPEGGFFYGHMVFSNDGSKALGSIFLKGQGPGIGVFEFPKLRLTEFVPTPQGSAHDIVPLDAKSQESKDLFFFGFARKENGPPSFGIFDLKSLSVSEIETGLPARPTPATIPHLKDCGDRIIANIQEAGNSGYLKNGELVSFDKKTRAVKTEIPLGPLAFDSDMLSLEYDPHHDFAWITLPYLNRIEVWDLRRGNSVRHITFHQDIVPTAVSFLSSLDLVVVTSRSRFFAFNAGDASQNAKFEENLPHSLLRDGHTAHTRLVEFS